MRENRFYRGTGYGESATDALDNLLERLDSTVILLTTSYKDVVIEGVSHDVMAITQPDVHDFKFQATALIHYTVEKG